MSQDMDEFQGYDEAESLRQQLQQAHAALDELQAINQQREFELDQARRTPHLTAQVPQTGPISQEELLVQFARAISTMQDQMQAQLRNQESREQKLPQFKIPSVKPPTFRGDSKKQNAHEAQAQITAYLREAELACETNDLLGDFVKPRFTNQKTYVQWLQSGLSGQALVEWTKIDSGTRHNMSWKNFQSWIQQEFSSPLSLQEAVHALEDLKQKNSCVEYSKRFNDLLEAMRAEGLEMPDKYLCIRYRRGLKDNLATEKKLFDLEDIDSLQKEAERLDKFFWQSTGRSNKEKSQNQQQNGRFFRSERSHGKSAETQTKNSNNGSGPTPMELGNTEARPKLTKEEKTEYWKKGWCVFCRAHDHTLNDCKAPGKRTHYPAKVNNIETKNSGEGSSGSSGIERDNKIRDNDAAVSDKDHTANDTTKTKTTTNTEAKPWPPGFKKDRLDLSPLTYWVPYPKTTKKSLLSLSLYHVGKAETPSRLLTFDVTIRGKSGTLLLDPGADPSYIKTTLAKGIGSFPSSDQIFQISLAARDQHALEGRHHRKLEFNFEGINNSLDLIAANIEYDIILGMDWLEEHNPTIDWEKKTVTFKDGRTILANNSPLVKILTRKLDAG
ncbi:hypothetical protein HDU67_000638 [Dinochytrium kinnereticum]|nr:hypothetical protein HDU67_000638 [Dinochytrium kinnereticum]